MIGEDAMNELEIIHNLLDQFDFILDLKYAKSDEEKSKLIERRYELLIQKLAPYSKVDIHKIEESHK